MDLFRTVMIVIIVAVVVATLCYIFCPWRSNIQVTKPHVTNTPRIFIHSNISVVSPPLLHQTLPTKSYNPSAVVTSNKKLVRTIRLSTFTKCPNSLSELYYKSKPHELTSRILLDIVDSTGYSVFGNSATRQILLDIDEPPITVGVVCESSRLIENRLRYVPGYEDARIVEWNQHLYCIVNARRDDKLGKARVHIVYVCHVNDLDTITSPHKCLVSLLSSPYDNPNEDEKNWSPFVDNERLYLVYSIVPLRVLEVPSAELLRLSNSSAISGMDSSAISVNRDKSMTLDGIIHCIPVSTTRHKNHEQTQGNHIDVETIKYSPDTKVTLPNNEEIPQSRLRGGTQLVRVGDRYIGIGHFRSGDDYYSVPYSISTSLPFSLLHVGTPRKYTSSRIEYVSGLRLDNNGVTCTLSYGSEDCCAMELNMSIDELRG